jgi:segregation and condensation protein B
LPLAGARGSETEPRPSGSGTAASAVEGDPPALEEVPLDALEGAPAQGSPTEIPDSSSEDAALQALIEAAVYITEEPLSLPQLAQALEKPEAKIREILDRLQEEYARPERGLFIREVAGGFKMATKPEHHEAIRAFVKNLKPPLKLSLAALETLAVIAYKQPITGPEIAEVRGVQGTGVLKTLLDRKLIASAGRKNVVGKPILYKTTKEFLVQFGLKDLNELPTLKEFEELRRLALNDSDQALEFEQPASPAAAKPHRPAEEVVEEAEPADDSSVSPAQPPASE